MITGDRRFGPGHPRFELQKAAVEGLEVIFWGRDEMFPRVPEGRFDVVTVQDPFFRGLFGLCVARRLHASLNVQMHADLNGQSVLNRIIARFVLSRADSVRVVSERLRRQLKTVNYKLKTEPVVLPVFVDISIYEKTVRRPHDGKIIMWLGRFEPEKNPFAALDVFARVRESVDAQLLMLGQGSLESTIRKKAEHLPVEFPGWRDPTEYFPRADVVLSTSWHESWGASIVEALAAGVPVVAPDVGVAKEAGAIVVPRERLAEAVIEALNMGAKGELRLSLPDAHEWATRWRESLL